eukprot:9609898-Karenia_brevis.AAC.1
MIGAKNDCCLLFGLLALHAAGAVVTCVLGIMIYCLRMCEKKSIDASMIADCSACKGQCLSKATPEQGHA